MSSSQSCSAWFAAGLWACMSACALGCSPDESTESGRGSGGGAGSGSTSKNDFGNSSKPADTVAAAGSSGGGTGCKPGHYVGSFEGTYNSAAWGNGSAPLMVSAVESNGIPGLEFWLEKTEKECTTDEFCGDFTVKGGKIRGNANPFSDPNAPPGGPALVAVRFEIDLGGELDCSTGVFKGLLQNGCYDVATVLYRFEGTMPGTYDKPTTSFTEGEWTVKEIPMQGVLFPPDANIGGMGTWTAAWQDDVAPPVTAGMGLCDTP